MAARRASVARLSLSGVSQPLVLDEPLPHTSLHDLLTAPFMRVSKYVWLLSSLLRATPEGHPDNLVLAPEATASPTSAAVAAAAAASITAVPASAGTSAASSASSSASASASASGPAAPHSYPTQLLPLALKAVQQSLFQINASILVGDNLDKLTKLQSERFVGAAKDLDLVAPNRHLLREGVLLRHTRSGATNYYFHLFSDMLIYSSVNVQGKYKLHRKLPLMTLQILDTGGVAGSISGGFGAASPTAALELEIRSPQKSFVVVARNRAEKEAWLEDVQLAIRAEAKRKATGGVVIAAGVAAASANGSAAPGAGAAADKNATAAGGAPGLMSAAASSPSSSSSSAAGATAAPLWAKDHTSENCTICTKKFTLWNRRHHCRVCGILCCDACSKSKKLMPTIDREQPVRVCDKCKAC